MVETSKGIPNTGGHDPGMHAKQEGLLDHCLIEGTICLGVTPLLPKDT